MIRESVVANYGWLAHSVSRFASNTNVIVDTSSNPPFSNVKCYNKNVVSIHQVNK